MQYQQECMAKEKILVRHKNIVMRMELLWKWVKHASATGFADSGIIQTAAERNEAESDPE